MVEVPSKGDGFLLGRDLFQLCWSWLWVYSGVVKIVLKGIGIVLFGIPSHSVLWCSWRERNACSFEENELMVMDLKS